MARRVFAPFALAVVVIALAVTTMGVSIGAQTTGEDALVKKARAIHDRVIALDTHNDISPSNFTAERNYTQRL